MLIYRSGDKRAALNISLFPEIDGCLCIVRIGWTSPETWRAPLKPRLAVAEWEPLALKTPRLNFALTLAPASARGAILLSPTSSLTILSFPGQKDTTEKAPMGEIAGNRERQKKKEVGNGIQVPADRRWSLRKRRGINACEQRGEAPSNRYARQLNRSRWLMMGILRRSP